jgi:hypothetical protein
MLIYIKEEATYSSMALQLRLKVPTYSIECVGSYKYLGVWLTYIYSKLVIADYRSVQESKATCCIEDFMAL